MPWTKGHSKDEEKKWFGHTHCHDLDVELQLGTESASAWPEKSDRVVSIADIDIYEESNVNGMDDASGLARGVARGHGGNAKHYRLVHKIVIDMLTAQCQVVVLPVITYSYRVDAT
jgi:hypothetical protein